MKSLLSFVMACVLFATRAIACTPAPPKELFARTEFLLIATAIGSEEANTFELPVKYKVLKVLSGKAPTTHWAGSPCHLPIQVGERVVVGTYQGRQYLYPVEFYEGIEDVGR